MNEVINLLTNHRSYREYKDEPVTDEQISQIVNAAMSSANWINGQQVTIIEVQDKERKAKLAELVGNQKYVDEAPVFFVFCLDFYRAKLAAEKQGKEFNLPDSGAEALMIGATDVGIALGTATSDAESMGLGTVPIGGIRRNPQEVIELLELPEYVFPVSGLVLGHPASDPGQKPRLPVAAVHHKESYNKNLKEYIDQFDDTFSNYMLERTNGEKSAEWSGNVAVFYSERYKIFADNVIPALKNQGFNFND